MAEVTATLVKELRERTGAGMMECKKALIDAQGDMERAIELLRERGLAQAAKRAGRVATEGVVGAYIHGDGRIGVLIEVNCETDFVAKTEDFQNLVKDLAMQVAAARPEWVRREEVPQSVIEAERRIYETQARNEGKPEQVLARIVEGRLEKFFQERCLMEQPFIKDPDRRVEQVVQEVAARLGEHVTVRRFARFERGEGLAQQEDAEA